MKRKERAGALHSRDKGLSRLPTKRKAKKHTTPVATALVRQEPQSLPEKIEQVLIGGDLAPLAPPERVQYYKALCKSLGLNPLTNPFQYISLNGKLVLYAKRDCTDQLRKIYGVSVSNLKSSVDDNGMCLAQVEVKDRMGRTDAATGAVWVKGMAGSDLANAMMKAETKAKRRATLSLCGLGFFDESEMDSVEYNDVTPEGRVIHEAGERGTYQAAQDVATRKLAEHAAKQLPVGATTATQAEPAKANSPADTHQPVASKAQTTAQGPQTPAVEFKPDVLIQFSKDSKYLWMIGQGCTRLGNILKAAGTLNSHTGIWEVPGGDSAEMLKAMDDLKIKYAEQEFVKAATVSTTAPPAQPAAAKPPQAKPAATRPAQPPQAKRGDYAAPPAKIPDHVPVSLVEGKLEKLYTKRPDGATDLATTGGSRFIRIVVGGIPYTIFANHKMSLNGRDEKRLFEIIEELPIGSHVRFTAHKDAKDYWNVDRVLQLGELEWDETTGLSVLRRGDIPGQAKLL